MTLTLLLDLDDTLLATNKGFFQVNYVKSLSTHLAHRIDPNVLVTHLMAATEAMLRNNRPDITLEQVFDTCFYPSLGISRAELQDDIDHFYAEVYPELQKFTKPRPGAIHLVETAFERGYQVAVATNPLFPRTATLQRLRWAGLPVEQYPFRLVSTYEDFHFAKPNPAYFAEMLAQLGWPDDPIVMVGNDLSNDITPAAQAGIHAFHITGDNASFDSASPSMSGSILDCLQWIDHVDLSTVCADYSNPAAVCAILKSTPAAMSTLLRSVPAAAWNQRPLPGEWSLTEIICHLRDVEIEVNHPRLRLVTEEENPFVPGQVTDPWAEERGYIYQDGKRAMEDFLRARMETLKTVSLFSPEVWEHQVRHAIFGPTGVRELVGFISTHDRTHIQQIVQTKEMVKQPEK